MRRPLLGKEGAGDMVAQLSLTFPTCKTVQRLFCTCLPAHVWAHNVANCVLQWHSVLMYKAEASSD
jgi:hypothetical protein